MGLRNSWCSIFFNPIRLNLPWILFSLCCFYFLFTILISHLRSRIHKVSLRLWASLSSKDQKVKHQNRSIDIFNSKSKALMIGFKCYWINNLKKKNKTLLPFGSGFKSLCVSHEESLFPGPWVLGERCSVHGFVEGGNGSDWRPVVSQGSDEMIHLCTSFRTSDNAGEGKRI